MLLTKGNQTISLDNPNHISAFLECGWKETEKVEKKPEKKKEK